MVTIIKHQFPSDKQYAKEVLPPIKLGVKRASLIEHGPYKTSLVEHGAHKASRINKYGFVNQAWRKMAPIIKQGATNASSTEEWRSFFPVLAMAYFLLCFVSLLAHQRANLVYIHFASQPQDHHFQQI